MIIDYRAARESDLLAFEIAVRDGQPGMVMCSYNLFAGNHVCENEELLNQTLKKEWAFKGWVISDWAATHSTEKAILAGLDQEQPGSRYFGASLAEAVNGGRVPVSAVDASVRRILRTMFATRVVDNPPEMQVVDVAAGLKAAQDVAEKGIVLLRNQDGILPLASTVRTVAVIGGHADVGVLTGGGSGQVDPPGGNAVKNEPSAVRFTTEGIFFPKIWWPSSPLAALRAAAPGTRFIFDDGKDSARAAALARSADMAIVFAYAPSSEEHDNPMLGLPEGQDGLIDTVATANPRSIVVLETTGPVTMPWLDKTGAVVAAWFPGARGGEAIAALLTGKANFTAKLPITFPRSEADLPHPKVQGGDLPLVPMKDPFIPGYKTQPPFDIRYDEGVLVGYKWFEANGRKPLFAFGYGLSYTTYTYANLKVTPDAATFSVTNTGSRAGIEIAQVYASLPARIRLAPRQLVGWAKVALAPGETRTITVRFEPLTMSAFDTRRRIWTRPKGEYRISVGGSSDDTPLVATTQVR
ncbi:MAG: glycoside hydrolase family 3 C-terminal domain-containing protein [Candidatus Sphingomonas colombiensis]|nr:glycoside hydrolase family 3 protein [Sphingomonas sp.]WEK43178.1 MAG: glycoside hydrolase family 3 C-terminal domain-containing protein [Sphingomonas sp.]